MANVKCDQQMRDAEVLAMNSPMDQPLVDTMDSEMRQHFYVGAMESYALVNGPEVAWKLASSKSYSCITRKAFLDRMAASVHIFEERIDFCLNGLLAWTDLCDEPKRTQKLDEMWRIDTKKRASERTPEEKQYSTENKLLESMYYALYVIMLWKSPMGYLRYKQHIESFAYFKERYFHERMSVSVSHYYFAEMSEELWRMFFAYRNIAVLASAVSPKKASQKCVFMKVIGALVNDKIHATGSKWSFAAARIAHIYDKEGTKFYLRKIIPSLVRAASKGGSGASSAAEAGVVDHGEGEGECEREDEDDEGEGAMAEGAYCDRTDVGDAEDVEGGERGERFSSSSSTSGGWGYGCQSSTASKSNPRSSLEQSHGRKKEKVLAILDEAAADMVGQLKRTREPCVTAGAATGGDKLLSESSHFGGGGSAAEMVRIKRPRKPYTKRYKPNSAVTEVMSSAAAVAAAAAAGAEAGSSTLASMMHSDTGSALDVGSMDGKASPSVAAAGSVVAGGGAKAGRVGSGLDLLASLLFSSTATESAPAPGDVTGAKAGAGAGAEGGTEQQEVATVAAVEAAPIPRSRDAVGEQATGLGSSAGTEAGAEVGTAQSASHTPAEASGTDGMGNVTANAADAAGPMPTQQNSARSGEVSPSARAPVFGELSASSKPTVPQAAGSSTAQTVDEEVVSSPSAPAAPLSPTSSSATAHPSPSSSPCSSALPLLQSTTAELHLVKHENGASSTTKADASITTSTV